MLSFSVQKMVGGGAHNNTVDLHPGLCQGGSKILPNSIQGQYTVVVLSTFFPQTLHQIHMTDRI